jgi:3-oxoacyl-[acyl-carrier protein] reductase
MAADGHFDIVALVTGGGTGVGRAICLQLAARGARVAVNYSRSAAEAQQTADEARAAGGEAVTLQADIADVTAADGLVAATVERFGRLDFLVNNAGTTRFVDYRDLDALDDALWDRLYAVNVKGAFYCARAAAATMRRTGGGSIVNVASVSGLTGSGSSIPYACSKAAMLGLTKALATALAPDVRVNAVAPGYIHTRWHASHDADWYEQRRQQIPLRRLGTAEDVAAAVIALGLDMRHATGQTVVIDGGQFKH